MLGTLTCKHTIMKQTTKKSTAVIMAVCLIVSGFSAFANNKHNQLPVHNLITALSSPAIQVDLKWLPGSETLNLVVDNPAGKKFSVILRDATGSVLTRSIVPKDQIRLEKNYLFTDAEEGNYSIDVCDGKNTVSKKITLQRVIKTETVLSIN
jgi:hypothetical protein